MFRRSLIWMPVAILLVAVVTTEAAKKKRNTKKTSKKKDNTAQVLKQVTGEIKRVRTKIETIEKARDAAAANLKQQQDELERLRADLSALGSDDNSALEKKQIARRIHGAIGDVKDGERSVANAELLLAQGRTLLAKLESQQRALAKKSEK